MTFGAIVFRPHYERHIQAVQCSVFTLTNTKSIMHPKLVIFLPSGNPTLAHCHAGSAAATDRDDPDQTQRGHSGGTAEAF